MVVRANLNRRGALRVVVHDPKLLDCGNSVDVNKARLPIIALHRLFAIVPHRPAAVEGVLQCGCHTDNCNKLLWFPAMEMVTVFCLWTKRLLFTQTCGRYVVRDLARETCRKTILFASFKMVTILGMQ